MTVNRVVIAAATVAVGMALAGCSTATESAPPTASKEAPAAVSTASPAAFIAQAADSTTSAGSARIVSTTTVTGLPSQGTAGQETTIQAEGVVNFARNEAALTVSAALFGGDSDMQVVLVGGQSYIKVPMFGEKWIAMPMKDLGLNVADPTQGLDLLKQAADLQEVGKEPVDGVEATKYTGTIDLQEALGSAGLPADAKDDLPQQLDKVTGDADVIVWVDEEGRIIRFDQTATIDNGNGNGNGKTIETTSSTTMSDFGVPTDITAPPADQVLDSDALQKMGDLAGNGG
jgi:hypothetical protein